MYTFRFFIGNSHIGWADDGGHFNRVDYVLLDACSMWTFTNACDALYTAAMRCNQNRRPFCFSCLFSREQRKPFSPFVFDQLVRLRYWLDKSGFTVHMHLIPSSFRHGSLAYPGKFTCLLDNTRASFVSWRVNLTIGCASKFSGWITASTSAIYVFASASTSTSWPTKTNFVGFDDVVQAHFNFINHFSAISFVFDFTELTYFTLYGVGYFKTRRDIHWSIAIVRMNHSLRSMDFYFSTYIREVGHIWREKSIRTECTHAECVHRHSAQCWLLARSIHTSREQRCERVIIRQTGQYIS